MKKKTGSWKIIAVLLVLVFFMGGCYNKMLKREEAVTKQWSDVESQYQRRMDLIPNLVNTVKGYADFEKETLTQVIEARSKATSVNVNPEQLNPESIQKFQQAQAGLKSALSRLMVVVERYPELKANQNFMDLQAQLEGTENRIAVARRKYNEAVKQYNYMIKKFPNNIFAGIYGFERKGYFEADTGAEEAPKVEF